MAGDDVELIERETAYRGYFTLDRYALRFRRYDGAWSPVVHREVFDRGHAVGVLPYDPVLDAVVLIEQFRMGPYAVGERPWLVEVVAGIVEPGEAADEVARRETAEEAGLTVTDLVAMGKYYTSPGALTESVTLYCGRVDAADAGGVHGLDHEHEDIRVFPVPAAELPAWLADGRIGNLSAATALQWLLLHRETLRARWG